MATNRVVVLWKQFTRGARKPVYKTDQASGADLFACLPDGEAVALLPGKHATIPIGIGIMLPPTYEAQIRSRSGLAANYQVVVLNSPGTIDADYRGEIKVVLFNASDDVFIVTHGMRIAQLCVQSISCAQFIQVYEMQESKRGEGGFGHTGL